VKFVWYDGKKEDKQNAPDELLKQATEEARRNGAEAKTLTNKNGKKKRTQEIDDPQRWDLILVGDAGMMLFNRGSTDWVVTPAERARQFADVPQTLPRVTDEDAEWVAACNGGPKPLSSFDYAGPFTEVVLLGNLAVRLGKKIEWDAVTMKATNAPEADELIRPKYRAGWELPVPAALSQLR
jgi:hypothetical protein